MESSPSRASDGGDADSATAVESRASIVSAPPADRELRVRIGSLWIDALTYAGALERIVALVRRGQGGSILTPNVDHVMLAAENPEFRRAYRHCSASLVDGMPLLWASHLLRTPLPEKLSGSDLVEPIAQLAAEHGWRISLLGGAPGVAERVAGILHERFGVEIASVDAPHVVLERPTEEERLAVERIRQARPHILFVALGSPKQEIWIERMRRSIGPTVAIGIGATFDFLAGNLPRAPRWVSRAGLEWLFRLIHEPRRLWHRYLVRDPAFVLVVLRSMLVPRRRRVRPRRTVSR